ncbi:GH36-type glycosyl hydrolase domain-containing protein [Paenibacillus harenae]|uniref:GH36-type glycosyl hydrolase domain-containing protein n=1 Tax=Paenibacillus harenae TaxID=306543 RepID=UPI002792ECFE|nr:glucoamylase family protein [Paenibacillus harenae]MDQ0064107.1 cellobiose phosphorylase [Paenibacillus harenae]
MEWNQVKLQEHAHKLALEHDPHGKPISSKSLWLWMEEDVRELRHFIAELNERAVACEQPAEEWFLDHSEFLEAELAGIKLELGGFPVNSLPVLSKSTRTRVSSICEAYLAYTDGLLNEDLFVAYLNAYQEVAVLTAAEAWSIPLFLKMELVRRLVSLAELLKERRAICGQVERMLSAIPASELTPERLKQSLEAEQVEMPLSGAMIVHLVKHLREHAEDSAHVGEWLICKMENEPADLDAILSYEYRLQAEYQVGTGNVIGSLRKLSRWLWNELFERVSIIEQTLRQEQAGDYPRLDGASRHTLRYRVELLARRMKVPENLVASQAVRLADEHYSAASAPEGVPAALPSRSSYVSYYLLDACGMRDLRQALKQCGKAGALPEAGLRLRASGLYLQMVALGTLIALTCFSIAIGVGAGLDFPVSAGALAACLLLLLIPASDWAVTVVHWLIERMTRPTRLLRYDFSKGVPEEASTMVIIPVIWSRPGNIRTTFERLELHYLANREPNIHFGILSDFQDADAEKQPEDDALLQLAKAEIDRLNREYPAATFHLFHRSRLWNPSEHTWMGWERKRGKLEEFVKLLKGERDTSYDVIYGDSSALKEIRYVITLDADTQLPLESARRMIGAIHLPYNRPRLDRSGTKVAEGYGVLQPRIGMTYESARKSRLTALFAFEAGLDPYAFSVSDPYQDAIGQGIFTGKGIFDVDAFHRVLGGRFPENRVLSHDLLEGGFLRAGLLSDIELIDDHPPSFLAQQKRLHRWTRGDWQLLPWLRSAARNGKGELSPTLLSPMTRWQIADNLRRSLLQPALLAILLTAAPLLPGSPLRWYAIVLMTMLLPVIRQLFSLDGWIRNPGRILRTAAHTLLSLITLPFQSAILLDAVVRTLYRLLVSKRLLLEWTSQAEVERLSGKEGAPPLDGMLGGYTLTALMFANAALPGSSAATKAVVLALALLWCAAPLVVRWLDGSPKQSEAAFTEQETEALRNLSRDIWSFYEDFVTEHDNWLPPDNVQLEPDRGIAHRTSPTNIGMYAICAVAARDFGFIDTTGLIERLERTVNTIELLEKWEGHLYNWYDTESLAPLMPVYVSTVDSGNLVAALMAVKEGLVEWMRADWGSKTEAPGSKGPEHRQQNRFEVAFADELGIAGKGDLMARGNRLAARIDALAQGTDFRHLYDSKTNLFSLGYHVTRRERDEVLYDLLASEARQASFVAIAMGQVPVSHWNALGRTMTKVGGKPALLSWSGTMFEYLMPWLLMRTYRHTIWDSTYKAVVSRQIEYAKQRNVPFGISESGYYAFDHQLNYQYRAFGVPGLGFKRGLEQDLVLAPYATIMAMPYAPKEGLRALKRMEELGARGPYGYYEAMDFTPRRLKHDRRHAVIRSFMAHHQGMSLLTLSNMLLPYSMIDRFHRNKEVRAAELLLQERIPRQAKMIRHPALYRAQVERENVPNQTEPIREFTSPHTATPEACVLSNGRFSTIVTASGSGFSSWDGLSVSRWREEPVKDAWGSYIYVRDVASDRIWSPSFQPCRTETPEQRVRFEPDKATFERRVGEVKTLMEICVSPESDAEVRRITLTNEGDEPKILEVTSFLELCLANPIADDAHTAFSKLFIRTAYEESSGCIVASRRKREAKDQALWAAHTLVAEGGAIGGPEFETDRSAFIGRGYRLEEPQSIRTRLKGKTGSVADPAFVMRRRVQVEPGGQAFFYAVTSVAETKEAALEGAAGLAKSQPVERTFQLAWTRSRIELRSLGLELAEAFVFQRLAAQVLYTPPLSGERGERILANAKGQPGLWAFGISGDRPIIVAEIDNRSRLPFVIKLLTGHEYLRRLGIRFDLVLLNRSSDGYEQDLQDALSRAVEHGVDRFGAGHANIHVLPTGRLSEDDETLLLSVARLLLRASGPSLAVQLRQPRGTRNSSTAKTMPRAAERSRTRQERSGIESAAETAEPKTSAKPLSSGMPPHAPPQYEAHGARTVTLDAKDVLFHNGWGGFTPDGKQYKLLIEGGKHLPAPWINVLANPEFGTIVSELGTGYTFWRNSRECKLTPWSNDPVLDPPGEIGYLRDEDSGSLWTIAPSAGSEPAPYLVTQGLGNTTFEHERNGIRHTMEIFVPLDDPVKIMRLRLTNDSPSERRISVTYYAEWVIGVQRQSNASFIASEWDGEAEIMTAQNRYQDIFREATPFLGVFPQQAADEEGLSWTADQLAFVGRNGSLERPAALSRACLDKRDGVHYASCGAVQRKLKLQPGEETEVIVLLGCASSRSQAAMLARKYADAGRCDAAWQGTAAYWEETLGQIVVDTPSVETNILLNGWLLYQSLACRMWARTAFYQAGGAFGFRDQLQDSLAILHTRPELTRRQILLSASHQYEEGDVQHWWHEETNRGIRTLFSDDLLWLPYSVSRYIEHTGDGTVLDEPIAYLTSETLREGEHERYEETVRSDRIGSVYEHCAKAIDKSLLRIGEHGLPHIGVGDWNDGMNLVGDEGRGESVWLGWFLCEVLKRFEPLCVARGESERGERFRMAREKLAESLHEHAWDGQWYRRAFTDAGTWLGSLHNEECRIDAIAQSWSVISGAAAPDRALQAMKSFDRELVDREMGVVRLLAPPFDRTEPSPGYIQGYPPGIRENGAQYTHGVIWSIVAWCKLGRGDKAFELFRMLNPVNHTRTEREVRTYYGEPYVMAADVYTAEPHQGHAGWTWYTGASSWMYQSGIEWILGLRRQGSRLYLNPCVPSDWPGYKATYRFGQTRYHLHFLRDCKERFDLSAGPDTYIELEDEGGEQHLTIRLT